MHPTHSLRQTDLSAYDGDPLAGEAQIAAIKFFTRSLRCPQCVTPPVDRGGMMCGSSERAVNRGCRLSNFSTYLTMAQRTDGWKNVRSVRFRHHHAFHLCGCPEGHRTSSSHPPQPYGVRSGMSQLADSAQGSFS